MAKVINFTFEGNEYTLEFTRATVQAMERGGFNLNDIDTKPASTLPALFYGAFNAHHRHMKDSVKEEIFKTISNKQELFLRLAEMYREPIDSMIEEKEEEGNVTWGANW